MTLKYNIPVDSIFTSVIWRWRQHYSPKRATFCRFPETNTPHLNPVDSVLQRSMREILMRTTVLSLFIFLATSRKQYGGASVLTSSVMIVCSSIININVWAFRTVSCPYEMKPLKRHRCRCENNIKMDLREIGWWGDMDCIHADQDRD
jgi:hypothetical protein